MLQSLFGLLTIRELARPQQLTPVRFMQILSTLKPSQNSTKKFKRLGRGPSSNKGKTSGRGTKGQKARSHIKSWFEGGQTPIYKLFPKVGFTNVHSKELVSLNLERIVEWQKKGRLDLQEGETLTMKKMKDSGLISGSIKDGVKLLARGQFIYNLPWSIEATQASKKAVAAIEKAGGSFVAKYFTPLSLTAHLYPEWFLKKRGWVPLPARPTKRKDIEYYSDPEKKGYLVVENDPFYQLLQENKAKKLVSKTITKKSTLEKQLDNLVGKHHTHHIANESKIVTFDELKK
ncbi:YmL10 [Monosporozyma unispora]|nr:YmL10 [Kazachstania unispora]